MSYFVKHATSAHNTYNIYLYIYILVILQYFIYIYIVVLPVYHTISEAWLHQGCLQHLTLGRCFAVVNLLLASRAVFGKRQCRLVPYFSSEDGETSLSSTFSPCFS